MFGLGGISLDLDGQCPCHSTDIIYIQRACRRYGAGGPSQQSLGGVGGSSGLQLNIWIEISGLGDESLDLDSEGPCNSTVIIEIDWARWWYGAGGPSHQSLGGGGGSSELKPNIWIGRCIPRGRSWIRFGSLMPALLWTFLSMKQSWFIFDVCPSVEEGMIFHCT